MMINAWDETQPEKQDIKYKSVSILLVSITNIQIWKETQPEIFHLLQDSFGVNLLQISASGSNILVQVNVPCLVVDDFLKSLKETIEKIDSIQGTKTSSKVLKTSVGLSLENFNFTLENVQEKLTSLEMKETANSISIKKLLKDFSDFQIHFFKKLEKLQEKVDLNFSNLQEKTLKLEKIINKRVQ